MQVRGLLIAVILLAALGVGVYVSEKNKKDDDKKGSSADAPKIVTIPEDQITQIDVRRKDGTATVLKKTGTWQIATPEGLMADQEAVSTLVGAVASINSDRIVEENATDLSNFGLATPQVQVIVTRKDGKATKLLIGDETATGNAFFAKVDGDNKIYTVGSMVKTAVDKNGQDLRDKRLLVFDINKLSRLEVSAKGPAFEIGKNGQSEWQIVKPKPLRADNWGVEELLRKIKDAKMDTSVTPEDAKKAAADFASATKVATVRVTDASGNGELEIRKKDKDYFAKGSAVPGVYKVSNELGEGLDKSLDDFRNKKLFDFGFSDPSRIEVKIGNDTEVYEKKGDDWMAGNQKMDSVSVQSFVDKLRDFNAGAFADTGYTTPVIDIKLTAKEGKIVDHILISQGNNEFNAIREGEPTVYKINPVPVEELKKAAGDIKPPAPKDTKKEEKKK